jgi:hypothetical protein
MAAGYDIGLSSSDATSLSQNNPTSINISGASSPVVWLIIGAIVIMGLIVWLKKGKR